MARRRSPFRATITAAASRIINPESPSARSQAPDAETLYSLYRELGPIHAALQTKFLAASKIEYFPARRTGPGEDPERVEDGPAVEAYERIQGALGEFPDFIARMCMHWEIAGEGYLVQEDEADEVWAVWSPIEYEINRQQMQRFQRVQDEAPSLNGGFVMRSWRPDPMRRELPDSPLRAIRRECEQYVYLQSMVSAIAQSRLVAGMLAVPEEMSFPPKDTGDEADPFFKSLMDAVEATVQNPFGANRIAPIGIQGPADLISSVKFIDFNRDMPEWVATLMERVLRQMAVGMDLPPEQMTGLGDMNHWGAWLADDSLRLNFVDPLVLNVLDSFTRGYLFPYLEVAGEQNPRDFLFWRDYSDLTSKVISPDHAIKLAELQAISLAALRRTVGFTEDDAPDEDDPAVATPAPQEFPAASDNVVPGVPVITAAGQKIGLGQIDHRLYAQISEAAQAALDRSLERAGAKIRQAANGKLSRGGGGDRLPKFQTLAAQIDGVPNHQVGLTVGPSVKATLQLTDDDLIPPGSFDALGRRVDKILGAGQTETFDTITELTGSKPDRDETQETSWRERAVAALLAGLGVLALRKLFTPDLLPDPAETGEVEPTQIPAPLIFDTLTIAGGGEPGFGPEAPRGLANGLQTIEWLDQVGFEVQEREWTIGAPANQFEPHRALRGVRITKYTDPQLTTPPTASWLGVSFMFPGDHSGCQCALELVVVEAFRGDSPASPATGGTSGAMPNEAMVPIWDPDTQTFLRLERRSIQYDGFEGVPSEIQDAIKRGINAYPPEFRPPRVEIVDSLGGPSGLAESFGIKLGKGEIRLSKEMWTRDVVSDRFKRTGGTAAARVEHVTRHEMGHWRQNILDDQAERAGRHIGNDLKSRLDAVVDDLIPDLETAEKMGLDYPWLVRDVSKRQIPGAPGNWDKEWFAELSAHISEGRALPQALMDLVEEYDTVS